MEYLHSIRPHPVIHGDLKIQNVLVGDGLVTKVCTIDTFNSQERRLCNSSHLSLLWWTYFDEILGWIALETGKIALTLVDYSLARL